MSRCLKSLVIASLLVLLAPGSLVAEKYNFGMIKRSVVLKRRLLPDLQLGNVSLMVTFPRGNGGVDSNIFSSDLETDILHYGGGTIRLVTASPEYEIRCFITGFEPVHITSTTENKVTVRQAHGTVSLDARLTRVSDGTVSVAFSETATLNASSSPGIGNVSLPFHIPGTPRATAAPDAPSEPTEPLPNTDTDKSLNDRLLKKLADHVASHMVLMDESIPVLLAQGGALDEADRLALNNRWTEYLEKISTIPPDPDAGSNAYLLFDLGVANEALGYAASDPQTALKYLRESSINYSKAVEGKPAEKYFVYPQKRIETAITRYTALTTHENTPPPPPPPGPATPPPPSGHRGEKLTNADVVKLVNAHFDPKIIANKIATAPAADFDLSVDGMISLSKSGVSNNLISVMTTRMEQGPQQPTHHN